jgi:hypothetical protein
MIELDVEGFLKAVRKGFQGRIIAADAGVTDRTHWHTGVGELRQVTGSAILVTGETWSPQIIIPMMTARAGRRCMTGTGVQEF